MSSLYSDIPVYDRNGGGDKVKNYAIALLGRNINKGLESLDVITVICRSHAEAIGLGYVAAENHWPSEEGWWHRVVAMEVLSLKGAEEVGDD